LKIISGKLEKRQTAKVQRFRQKSPERLSGSAGRGLTTGGERKKKKAREPWKSKTMTGFLGHNAEQSEGC